MSAANLASVLDRQAGSKAVAVTDLSSSEPVEYRYSDLQAMTSNVASALRARGHGSGARIGLLCGNSARFYAAYFGALRAGCTVVPYNARAGRDAIAHVCADAELELIISDTVTPDGIPRDLEIVRTDDSSTFAEWLHWGADSHPAEPEDWPALILYTSGSTGQPKGVMLSHASQLAIIDGLMQPVVRGCLARGPCIIAAPLFHMNGLVFSELAFAVGAHVILMRRFETRAFIDALDRHRVTVLSGVPTMVALLAQEREALAKADLSCVELVMIGSAPLSETVLAQAREIFPRAAVVNSYGTTEIGAGILGPHPDELPRPPMSIGYPAPHADLRLVGEDSPDQGVLEVRSPSNMTGYLNLPEITAARMKDGWINTGDIVRRDEHGFLYYVGRNDDMFVCSGENIYPGEIERLLERHPDVLEVSVVPLPDPARGHVPVAFVVARSEVKLSDRDIKEFVLSRAAPHLHPRRVWFLDRMPLSGVNKIDRHLLKMRALELAGETSQPEWAKSR